MFRLLSRRAVGLGAALAGACATGYAYADVASPTLPSLSKKEFKGFVCIGNEALSKDSHKIRLALPTPLHTLGMTVASCLSIQAEIEGETVSRPYTPISKREQKGYVDFVIKAYPPRTDGKPGGMGRHLCALQVGDSVDMKGPWKKFDYQPNEYSHVGMIAGGTGLTPMFQVIQEILDNSDDSTRITLLYANRTPDDILLRKDLTQLEAAHPGQFKVVFTVDQATDDWSGEVGFVTEDMVKKYLPAATEQGVRIFVCGPPPMMEAVCGNKTPKGEQGSLAGCLLDAGFTEKTVFKF